MEEVMQKLIAGETNIASNDIKRVMIGIAEGRYSSIQIAALLTALQVKGITADELLGFREGLLATGLTFDLSEYEPMDIVGTGGDQKNTFNISTCASFVCAGAGYKIAKHGNFSATSVSGASTVLQKHGAVFHNDVNTLRRSLDVAGIAYLHAPLFAKGMKNVAPVRKGLGFPTCFNLLGPLINPVHPKYQFLGVATLGQMRLYQNVLGQTNIEYAIVTSLDGYDEISLTSSFKMLTNHGEQVTSPAELGLPTAKADELSGGKTTEDAAGIFDKVLQGNGTESQMNVVIANAGCAIHLVKPEKEIGECLEIARESLKSGKALASFKKFLEINA